MFATTQSRGGAVLLGIIVASAALYFASPYMERIPHDKMIDNKTGELVPQTCGNLAKGGGVAISQLNRSLGCNNPSDIPAGY